MPVTSKEISTYGVTVISQGDPTNHSATILLFDASGKQIAFLGFYLPGVTMAPNEYRTDLDIAVVSYPYKELASVIDILRNEKPVSFYWYDYTPDGGTCFGAVCTGREPVDGARTLKRVKRV